MAAFRFRAYRADGALEEGTITSPDMPRAMAAVRAKGYTLVSLSPRKDAVAAPARRLDRKASAAAILLLGELSILLKAGLPLDRAMALAIGNIEDKKLAARFAPLLSDVREGLPLSEAMARRPDLLDPAAVAMTEAGEANGRLPEALTRVVEMLERAAELRRLISGAMIYPVALLAIAVGVVLLMLLFVVPQFEGLMTSTQVQLPAASRAVLEASRLVRSRGLSLLGIVVAAAFGLRFLMAQDKARVALDRVMLSVPQIGPIVRRIQTARFARILGALVEGRVALTGAVALAARTISNRAMTAALSKVVEGVRQGQGLSGPLAAARIMPELAIGFIRTGEESSELGLMLTRLADVLDRDVKNRIERVVAFATPLITIMLAAMVTGIVAAIMSAILGFNEVAVSG